MEEADWIAQIVAQPDDDAPRLVYADWLIQRGDPRGEFITVQCALARYEATDADVGDVAKLRSRERNLRRTHDQTWNAAAAEVAPSWALDYRRGFAEVVTRSYTGEFDALAALRVVEPLVRAIRVESRALLKLAIDFAEIELDDGWPDLAIAVTELAKPVHAGVRRLAFVKAAPEPATLQAMLELPQSFVELDLGFDGRLASKPTGFGPALAQRTSLETLTIRQLRHLDALGAKLATLPRLRSVTLENADIERKGLYALASIPALEALDVAENYSAFNLEGIDAARLIERAPHLRRLRLSKLGLGDKQAIAIARSSASARLTRLDLSRNGITDDGGLAIARSEHLRGLRRLNLNANRLSAETKAAVRAAFPAAEVQTR